MIILENTPVERYVIHGREILVKREDLCCPDPGPPFSKVRGIVARLEDLKARGYETIGYTETAISMAGWGLAWAAKELGLKCVIFDPQYKKNTPDLLHFHREQWRKFDAEIIPYPAGMAKVNFYVCRNILVKKYRAAIHLPLGLPFSESIDETAKEARRTIEILEARNEYPRTVVVNIGSGTIAAGIARAFEGATIWGVMGRTGDPERKKKLIMEKGKITEGLFDHRDLRLIDPGWEYTKASNVLCPFPSHPYYDLKAWEWLTEELQRAREGWPEVNELRNPILFWNIGRMK